MNRARFAVIAGQVLIVAFTIGAFAGVASATKPDPGSETTAVVKETSRTVNDRTVAVVQYTYKGETRVEFAPLEAIAGQTATIVLDSEGMPEGSTWDDYATLLVLVGIVAALLVVGGPLILHMLTDDAVRRAEWRKNNRSYRDYASAR